MKLKKCLKEWNAIVESLGVGHQTILIRKYKTKAENFLLYPTYSYSNDVNYLLNFKEEYRDFVSKNAKPKKQSKKTEIKYYAKVLNVFEKSPFAIKRLNQYHIWANSHVDFYLDGKKGYVWLLKIYKLKEPIFAEPTHSMLYSNLETEVDLSDSKPVLNSEELNSIIDKIK